MEDRDSIRAEIARLVAELKVMTPVQSESMRYERWKLLDRIAVLETQLDVLEVGGRDGGR